MSKNKNLRNYRKLALVTTSTGAILLIISIIRGAMMIVAFTEGLALHTFRDISFGVINIAFDFAIPFVGGIILIAAGLALLNIEFDIVTRNNIKMTKRSMHNHEVKVTGKMLNEGDRVVLDILSKQNTMLQSDIVSMSGFSKVKVHRILRKLYNIGIVKSSRFGITNRIVLVDGKNSALKKKA